MDRTLLEQRMKQLQSATKYLLNNFAQKMTCAQAQKSQR
jgi:hypothetical protein